MKKQIRKLPGGEVPLLHCALSPALPRAAHEVDPAVVMSGKQCDAAEKQSAPLVAFVSSVFNGRVKG